MDTRESNFVSIHEMLVSVSNSVCIVSYRSETNSSAIGTGFVFCENYILTCYHVVEDTHLDHIYVSFDYGKPSRITYFKVNRDFILFNEELDYAILQLDGDVDSGYGLVNYIGLPPENGGAYIIGHPAGGLKWTDCCSIIPTSERESAILEFTTNYSLDLKADKRLMYKSNSYEGSSGSPVISDNWKVVAMHSGGYTLNINDRSENNSSAIGTGFVFCENYILTCYHVVEDTHLDHIYVSFNYEKPSEITNVKMNQKFVVVNKELDYAILKISTIIDSDSGLVNYIGVLPKKGEVYIIGHPAGELKQTDRCSIIATGERESAIKQFVTNVSFDFEGLKDDKWLMYKTCFYDGSSGSPVISGLSKAKCDYLSKLLTNNTIDVLALQETHVSSDDQARRYKINGYKLVSSLQHPKYGLAIYVRNEFSNCIELPPTEE
nr:PREDICTED: uncharacterized protein LOC106706238 [Latimeria chalumnae]|eukprot:XP_014352330.1 PREDICTED: uncharacterized protein LOC106706238 [Latimeria chalumnae]